MIGVYSVENCVPSADAQKFLLTERHAHDDNFVSRGNGGDAIAEVPYLPRLTSPRATNWTAR